MREHLFSHHSVHRRRLINITGAPVLTALNEVELMGGNCDGTKLNKIEDVWRIDVHSILVP